MKAGDTSSREESTGHADPRQRTQKQTKKKLRLEDSYVAKPPTSSSERSVATPDDPEGSGYRTGMTKDPKKPTNDP